MKSKSLFRSLTDVVAALRDPDTGCPWDIEQTHSSIRKYFIEETYEAIEAIDQKDDTELCAELGDVLLQVMLHSQIAKDRGAFDIDDVVKGITDKMIRRHPHVFGDSKVDGSDEVLKNWAEIKKQEKLDQGKENTSGAAILHDIPKSLPALNQAGRIGEKSAKLGFDWPDIESVWKKVEEEREELLEVLGSSEFKANAVNKTQLEHELGDYLFSLSQLARWLNISPEDSLRACCKRFIERFETMEKVLELGEENSLEDFSIEKLEGAWQQAKRILAESNS